MGQEDDVGARPMTVWNANSYSIDLDPASPTTVDPGYDAAERELAGALEAHTLDPPRLVALAVARAINLSPPASLRRDDPFLVFVLDPEFEEIREKMRSTVAREVLERLQQLRLWAPPGTEL
jgi:hypothetical protein